MMSSKPQFLFDLFNRIELVTKILFDPKNQKKRAPLGRPPMTKRDPDPVIKFQPQKFFGPPVLSAIPDELVDVNPKRQTYAIKGSHPNVQLPVISTPIRDAERNLDSKENILTV
jgi:hypothetical protein